MKYFFLRSPFAFSEPSKRTTKSQNSYILSPTLTNYYSITSVSGFQVYPHNNMASQQQQQSAMVLYIPYTYGENDGRKGVTEEQVFWHMRNLKVGYIDHIDCKERTDRNGTHIRSWFVHFSTWTAPEEATKSLNDGGHLEITYDDYGHYWKLFKYTPSERRNTQKEFKVRIVSKEGTPIKNPFAALAIEGEDEVPPESPAIVNDEDFPTLAEASANWNKVRHQKVDDTVTDENAMRAAATQHYLDRQEAAAAVLIAAGADPKETAERVDKNTRCAK